MQTLKEQAREIPVKDKYDVVVVGGGPAGVGAALGAARQGMKTLVVEQFNCLGGVATAGGHAHISSYTAHGTEKIIIAGVAREIAGRIADEGFGETTPYSTNFEVEGLKFILEKMMQEADVDILYHTFFCDSIVENGEIKGVIIQNKTGRQAVYAERVIDCTGDGDVGYYAGCNWQQGRPSDGKCQPVTLMFTIGGVDNEKVNNWRTNYQMREFWEDLQTRGEMEPFQKTIMGFWYTPTRPDWLGVNFTHVTGVDCTKAEDLTSATIEARRQAYHSIDVFRKHVPGMENAFMVSTPNTIGLRESRRIMGEYVLNEEDVKAQRKFDDNVCYGSFFIDIHCIDGPGMDHTVWRPDPGFKYQIPYRTLVPLKIDNLLTAGRCISVTHVALGSTRVMVPCIGLGEAAGVAAAQSVQSNVTPREVDVKKVQEVIRNTGGLLSEADIERYNGQPAAAGT